MFKSRQTWRDFFIIRIGSVDFAGYITSFRINFESNSAHII